MIDLFRVMNYSYTLPQLKNEDNFRIISSHLVEKNILRASGTFYNSLIVSVFRESFQSFRSTKHASARAFPSIQKAFRLLDSLDPGIKSEAEDISAEIDCDRDLLIHETVIKTNNERLWRNSVPSWFDTGWESLREQLILDENGKWNFWIDWFQRRINGEKIANLKLKNGVSFSEFLSSRNSDFWNSGAEKINSTIDGWLPDNEKDSDNEKKLTVSDFIVNYLSVTDGPSSNNQILQAFKAARYQVIPKTMRGALSRLAIEGIIKRIRRGLYEIAENENDILFENNGELATSIANLQRYSEAMSTGSPVVISGSFFSLGQTWDQSDVDVAKQLIETGRCEIARRKVDRLYERSSQRLKNYQIWNDLIETLPELSEWLAMPPEQMAKRVGVAWELSVTVGRFIDLDKRLSTDSDSPHLRLDADVRLSLEDVNGSVGTLLREFPTGAAMDDRHREWNASQEAIEVARAIFINVEKTNLLIAEYLPLIARALKSDDLESVQGRKSAGWGVGTVKRIGLASIIAASTVTGGLVGGATGEVGAEITRQTQLSDKAAKLVLKSKDDLIEMSKDAPADIRNAVEDFIKRIENSKR